MDQEKKYDVNNDATDEIDANKENNEAPAAEPNPWESQEKFLQGDDENSAGQEAEAGEPEEVAEQPFADGQPEYGAPFDAEGQPAEGQMAQGQMGQQDGFVSYGQPAEGQVYYEFSETAVKKKKSPFIMASVIVAALVFVVTVLAFLGYYLLVDVNVDGTWSTYMDEEKTVLGYLTLIPDESVEENGGKAIFTVSTSSEEGTYYISNTEDGASEIVISISYYSLYGNYSYELSGNRLFGKQLTLSLEDIPEPLQLTSVAEVPSLKESIKPRADFAPLDDLTGKWEYRIEEEGTSAYISYEFGADGVFHAYTNEPAAAGTGYAVSRDVYGAYVSDGKIISVYYEDSEDAEPQQVEYEIVDGKLALSGIEMTRAE